MPEVFKPKPAEQGMLGSCPVRGLWSVSQPLFRFQLKHFYCFMLYVASLHKILLEMGVLLLLHEMHGALLCSHPPVCRGGKEFLERIQPSQAHSWLEAKKRCEAGTCLSVQKGTERISPFQSEYVGFTVAMEVFPESEQVAR